MERMMGIDAPHSSDNLGPLQALFRPPRPSPDLVRWLWRLTPPNAPTLPVLESRTHIDDRPDLGRHLRGDGPGHVPLLRHDRSIRSSHERLELVREALPPGIRRQAEHQAPRRGRQRWQIECAYLRDLVGHSELQIADSLDLTDHLNRVTGSRKPESRSARRYVQEGRKTLAALGAWPWAVENDGKLDVRGWWQDDRFAAALSAWHEEASVMAINDTLLSADNITGQERFRTSGDRLSIATELYRGRLWRLVEKADAA